MLSVCRKIYPLPQAVGNKNFDIIITKVTEETVREKGIKKIIPIIKQVNITKKVNETAKLLKNNNALEKINELQKILEEEGNNNGR